jgi:transposase-like protein
LKTVYKFAQQLETMNCPSCGERLTTKEFNAIQKRKDECSFPEQVKFLCEECEEEAQGFEDYANEQFDEFSDADPGL